MEGDQGTQLDTLNNVCNTMYVCDTLDKLQNSSGRKLYYAQTMQKINDVAPMQFGRASIFRARC